MTQACAVCGRTPSGHDPAGVGAVCHRCVQRMRDGLDTIAAAWQWLLDNPEPSASGAGPSTERSLPGGAGRLAYIARGSTSPHGDLARIAACMHATVTGTEPVHIPTATLPLIVQAIRADLEQGGADDIDIDLHAGRIDHHAAVGRDLCGWSEQGQWVTCPTIDTAGDTCGRRLRIDLANPDTPVTCWWCHTNWTPAQLLHRAINDQGDTWADPDSIASVTDIPAHQIRTWARTGKIATRGMLVRVADVMDARDRAIITAHRTAATRLGIAATTSARWSCRTCGEAYDLEAPTFNAALDQVEHLASQHAARHTRRWHTDGTSDTVAG